MTGTLPNLPSVLVNGLPALDEADNDSTRHHLERIYSARRAFTAAESSERIKRALRHPIRSCETFFSNGETVYYKRATSNKWRGPAKVIGQHSTKVFIVHGSRVLRCSSSRVISVNSSVQKKEEDKATIVTNDEKDSDQPDDDLVIKVFLPSDIPEDGSVVQQQVEEQQLDERRINEQRQANERQMNDDNEQVSEPRRSERNKRAPPKYIPEDGEWNSVEEEVNVVYVPVERHNEEDVINAKKAELANWEATEAVDAIEDKGQKLISTRWVITEKEVSPGQFKPKARLVIRGFEENNEDQVDAPTASKAATRTVLAIAANKQWALEHVDIKAAFLQGRKIDRDVFVKPPVEAMTGTKVWRLRKAAYGLVDAARNWYLSVKEVLIKLRCKQSNLDKAVFRWYENDEIQGIVVLHVDDFLFTGSQEFHEKVTEKMATTFKVGLRKSNVFKYVGLNIRKESDGIVMHQNEYVNELQEIKFNMVNGDGNLNVEEMRLLREISGQLLWISSQTRPDLSYDTLELNVSRNNASMRTLKRCAKVVQKAKQRTSQIKFRPVGDGLSLHVFADAGFCNLPDGMSSTAGFVILLVGENDQCILDWGSSKIKRKVSSTLEAEILALKESLNNAIYLGSLLTEFMFDDFVENRFPIFAFTDNKPTEQNIRSTKQVKEKRLRIDVGEIQRMLANGEIKDVKWVPTTDQIADGLTKRDVLSIKTLEW